MAPLVDKNLLRRLSGRDGGSRYEMLETVREYALERLAESGEREVQRCHAMWCIELAERPREEIWVGAVTPALLDAMSDEHDNRGAALSWLENEDAVAWLRMMVALAPFWQYRSHGREGWRWLERGLAVAANMELPVPLRARIWHAAAVLRTGQPEAEEYLAASLPLWRELGDPLPVAVTLKDLAIAAGRRGEYARAAVLLDEALAQLDPGDRHWTAVMQRLCGRAALGLGELETARHWFADSLARSREAEDVHGVALSLNHLAFVALKSDAPHAAAPLLTEGLAGWRGIARLEGLTFWLAEVAMLAAASGKPAAMRLWGAAVAQRQTTGYAFWLPERDDFARVETALRTKHGAAVYDREFAAGAALGLDEALAEAETVIVAAVAGESGAAMPAVPFGLTRRELDVLRLVVAGQTDREIAAALFISRRTAEGHVAAILSKLEVRTRAAAVSSLPRTASPPPAFRRGSTASRYS